MVIHLLLINDLKLILSAAIPSKEVKRVKSFTLTKDCITRKPVGHSLFLKPGMYSTSRC